MSTELEDRLDRLGNILERGDLPQWVAHLGTESPVRRAELAASFHDDRLVELVALVGQFGAAEVLEEAGRARLRLRREGADTSAGARR